MYQNSRVIIIRFNGKTQWKIFLLLYGRHVGAPSEGHQHGFSIQSSINLSETLFRNNAGITNRTDLNLGGVICLSITYHIPNSWLNLLNWYDFYFRCQPPIPGHWYFQFTPLLGSGWGEEGLLGCHHQSQYVVFYSEENIVVFDSFPRFVQLDIGKCFLRCRDHFGSMSHQMTFS